MSQDIRRELISKNLGIKPINHGQIHAFQIAIPDSRKQTLSLEHRQAIERSLLAHQSNLISLILRRTEAYEDEEIEYELVYGADWLQVAQELSIEKVWAWVFDLTDEQAEAAIDEMKSLSEVRHDSPPPSKTAGDTENADSSIANLIDKKLQLATDSIRNSLTPLLNSIRDELDEKLKVLNYRIDNLSTSSNGSDVSQAILDKLDTIQQHLTSSRRGARVEPIENPIDLLESSEQAIETALKQVGTQDKQIRAAIEAVKFWKQSEQGLTWENLEKSTRAKGKSQYKIAGFAEGTLNRLRAATIIAENR